ncbi:hypothetical protein CFOL_v3_18794 [Cephalotus follicularis]|uniref:C3H1-type domain-containing protein n=1 Tax=Cephalotus follicularis TaxID=3775 RepID=A0A1Q3C4Z7_CEPFO|nr:hypothetical protein CFOL_v3_18794 [Cephalotus follicularis]
MYSQWSYNPHFGQGPHTPTQPPFQQLPPGPPPPLHLQQVPSVAPPHISQPGPPIFQHGLPPPPPPPPLPHAVRQVQPGGIANAGHSYLNPLPLVHGSTLLPHMYRTAQQNSQYHSHLGTQNAHLPPLPPRRCTPGPDMLQGPSLFRVLPPPPSQGQTLHRAPVALPPPPPLPTSSILNSSSCGSFVNSIGGNSQLPPMALPPPPPSSPPPIPPSPPPTSSMLALNASYMSGCADPDSISNKDFGSKLRTPDFVVKAVALTQDEHNEPVHEGSLKRECESSFETASLVGYGSSSKERVTMDLLPPPSKAIEAKVIQKIEFFCQSIAKNGPDCEDIARRNEFGNPEYDFLFGGQPGSDAATAQEYFLWLRKKYMLACKKDEGISDSTMQLLAIESSKQSAAIEPRSPAGSDMDMEDDITQSDNDHEMKHSIEGLTGEHGFIQNKIDLEEQLHASQPAAECESAKDFQLLHSGSTGLAENGPVLSNHEHMTIGMSVSKDHSPIIKSTTVAEDPFASRFEKSTASRAAGGSLSKSSAAAKGIDSDKYCDQILERVSPFRLLQDYVSDNSSENDEPCLKDDGSAGVSPSVVVGAINLSRDKGINLVTDMGSKSPSKTEKGSGSLSKLSTLCEAQDPFLDIRTKVKETVTTFIASNTNNEHNDNICENQLSINHAASPEAFQKKDSLGGACVDVAYSCKFQKEKDKNVKSAFPPKVDEFGRLIREGASDSDSDDVHNTGRHSRQGRSWSRSRSPQDRRRGRRRSPRRRREKRSQSRSWSPRNRRSRSRSQSFRRPSEHGGDNMRPDKVRIPTCFDYLRGRCFRGASCRYLHHDRDKNDGSRQHRSTKQHFEVPPSAQNSSAYEETKHMSLRESSHEHDEVKMQYTTGDSFDVTKDRNIDMKIEDSASNAVQSVISNQDGEFLDSDIIKPENSKNFVPGVMETDTVKGEPQDPTTCINKNCQEAIESHQTLLVDISPIKPLGDADALKSHSDASKDVLLCLKNSSFQQSQSSVSYTVLQNTDYLPQQTDNSSISESSADRRSTSPSKPPPSEVSPNMMDAQHHPSQLPPPSSPLLQIVNASHKTEPPKDYNLTTQTASAPLQSALGDSFPSYMLPNQPSNFSVIPPWTSLPPPPPVPPYESTVNARTVVPGASSQFQQNFLPPRNDFGSQNMSRFYPTELPTHSQFSELQHRAYPSMQEPHQPVSHAEDFRLKPLPVYNPLSQQYGGPSSLRRDCLTQIRTQGLIVSNSHAQGHLPQPDNAYNRPEKVSSSRYPPDVVDGSQPPRLLDFGGSKSSSYYNSYAPPLEHPLSCKSSSAIFRPIKDMSYGSEYDPSFSLSLAPVDGQGVGSVGSRQATYSPIYARAVGQNFPKSGSDQYDPLFDSIEPSSKISNKFDNVQKWASTNNSDILLRLTSANQPLDIEENNRKKEFVAVTLSTSVHDEEYGETADAEVGVVENGSPSDPVDEANRIGSEIEIDQKKSPGKSKKSKDSRSMKLFKIAVADFVKEVLKPSWRQGNMSKEAFKTIVKKTVDKVSGAMKSHQVPKSKAKIEHYIDSSQRKLTKLVMGYVHKYVKV